MGSARPHQEPSGLFWDWIGRTDDSINDQRTDPITALIPPGWSEAWSDSGLCQPRVKRIKGTEKKEMLPWFNPGRSSALNLRKNSWEKGFYSPPAVQQ